MNAEETESLQSDFLKKFAAVPDPLRNEIIAVVNNQTYTWASAYLEISQKTVLGNEILAVLKDLKII